MSPSNTKTYDQLIRNVRVVRPTGNVVHHADIAIKDGKFARVAPEHRSRFIQVGARWTGLAGFSGCGRCPYAQWHLFTAS